jgi:vacuolar-type H+-ATPase subunit I/STV1
MWWRFSIESKLITRVTILMNDTNSMSTEMNMDMLEHTEANIRRIANAEPEKLGEGGMAIEFRVPVELDVEDVIWNGRQIIIRAYTRSEKVPLASLTLSTVVENGTIIVTEYGPGMLSAKEVREEKSYTPNAEKLKPIYQWLQSVGVEFHGLK